MPASASGTDRMGCARMSIEGVAGPRRVVLASASPRRRQLIGALDIPVEVVPSGVTEDLPRQGEPAEQYVARLALAKALQVAEKTPDAIVLGADTTVALDGTLLGKPGTPAEAMAMLRDLRGRDHRVVTGVVALDAVNMRWLSSATSTVVRMRRYSEEEIQAYVASGEPFDKAGAYAVQDPAFRPAQEVRGCYLNVVGLPLCEVVALLGRLGIRPGLKTDWQVPQECRDCQLGQVKGTSPI